MVDIELLRTVVVKGLREYIGCPVIRSNQNAEPPDYPYAVYTITTVATENNGTYGEWEDGIARKGVNTVWSITVRSNDSIESVMLANKAREWLDYVGTTHLNDNGVIVQSVTAIANRDNVLTSDYEYANGFDCFFCESDEIDISGIETIEVAVIDSAEVTKESHVNGQLVTDILAGTCEDLTVDAVTVLSDYALYYKTALKTVNLPNCVTVGEHALRACTSLETVNLPQVTSLGGYVFQGCTALTEINLPKVTKFNANAFYGCTALTEVNLPAATAFGTGVFEKCTSLKKVNLPMATAFGRDAFAECTSLEEFDFSVNTPRLREIKELNFFRACTGLRKVYIPTTIKTIVAKYSTSNIFFGCKSPELLIFCEATEKPSGWGEYWNYNDHSTQAAVKWGATHDEYLAY